jgi:hypothetical protein
MKAKINLLNIKSYLVGNFRYKIYYSYLTFLIREHIGEQIDWRIKVMRKECYTTGSCVECGCATTALQMCGKSCDGDCYPPLMSKKRWKLFKRGSLFYDKTQDCFWRKDLKTGKVILIRL